MVLYPQARAAVAGYAGQRKVYDADFDIATQRELDRKVAEEQPREDIAEARDLDADGVRCRLYRPEDAVGVIVHMHGGGFVFNDVDVHEAVSRRLANRTRMAVVSVDYRRPPEHPFPAAPVDVDTVLRWLDREGPALGLAGPTYSHGDSAGANLALVAALRNPGRFDGVVLIYPFLDPTAGFDSYVTAAEGFDLREAAWYWAQYAATPDDFTDPDLAPLLATNLASLPPTLIVTAEHDPLRDEGEHLAHLLAEAGVEVAASRQLGLTHGFWRHPDAYDAAEPLMRQVAGFLAMVRDRAGTPRR